MHQGVICIHGLRYGVVLDQVRDGDMGSIVQAVFLFLTLLPYLASYGDS